MDRKKVVLAGLVVLVVAALAYYAIGQMADGGVPPKPPSCDCPKAADPPDYSYAVGNVWVADKSKFMPTCPSGYSNESDQGWCAVRVEAARAACSATADCAGYIIPGNQTKDPSYAGNRSNFAHLLKVPEVVANGDLGWGVRYYLKKT